MKIPRKVYLSMKAFKEIATFSAEFASNYIIRNKWVESMGYLFCKQDGPNYIIGDATGISRGGETYVTMTPDDLAKVEKLDADRPDLFLGGWFHTHPGLSPFYSDTDILNQMFYQAQNEDGLGLVFDHSMVDPDFIGFKFFRLRDPQDPNTTYDEVEWFPLNWTEEGLEESFKAIGISSKIIEHLAYKFKLRKTAPPSELPPLTLPNVKDANQGHKLILTCDVNSQKAYDKGDIIPALISKRVQIALLKQFGNAEEKADNLLKFIEWAIEFNKFMTATDALNQLDLMNEDNVFPEDFTNYYQAKMWYFQAYVFQKQFRYSNAIEFYEKCIPPFEEEEEYDEECSKASHHIAECYEIQKEFKLALEWLEKAERYLVKAIELAEEEKEDEDDEEEIAFMKKELTNIKRFAIRIKAKNSAKSKGPMKIS
jgi:tetratricopeptide (TPR) repeat protein